MTRSSVSLAGAALAVAGALWVAAACSSSTDNNNCGSGTPPSLVGTYALESYTLGTSTITAPTATGTLRFYTSLYGVTLNLPNGTGGMTVVTDSGSYSVMGASCINESSVLGQPQFTGTFTYTASDSALQVTGTAAGQVAASIWKKTS